MMLVVGALLFPMALVLGLRYLTAYGTWAPVSLGAWAFFFGWYVAFFLGFFFPFRVRSEGKQPATGQAAWQANFWIIILSCAAAIGAGIMTYNFAVVRGFGFDVPATVLRSLVVEQANAGYVGSWLGGLGRFLVSAIAVAWIVTCSRWRAVSWLSLAALLASTVAVFIYQAKFEGGRLFFSATLLASFFASIGFLVSDVGQNGRVNILAVRSTHIAPVALLLLLSMGVSAYNDLVFVSRGVQSAQAFDRLKEVANAPAAKAVEQKVGTEQLHNANPFTDVYLQYASVLNIELSSARDVGASYGRAMAWIYLTQGISEFDRIFQSNNLKHAVGLYQFSQVGQILSKLTGTDMRYDMAKNLPNYGTYVALPGAFYVDFGAVLALVLAAVVGICFRTGIESMFSGASGFLTVLAPFLFVIVATGPVTSLVSNFWPCIFWIALVEIPLCAKPSQSGQPAVALRIPEV
ncbi:hypothetical protein [Bradyrhizobium sp. USDA 10063]